MIDLGGVCAMGMAFVACLVFMAGSNFGLSLDSICSFALVTPSE